MIMYKGYFFDHDDNEINDANETNKGREAKSVTHESKNTSISDCDCTEQCFGCWKAYEMDKTLMSKELINNEN